MQSLVNEKASRLLDLIFSETCENERVLADQLEELKDQARATVGRNDAGIIFRRSYVRVLQLLEGKVGNFVTS